MNESNLASWQELADRINFSAGHQLLTIGFAAKQDLQDRTWYQRAAIQRAFCHEGLFSIYIGWEAFFDEKLKYWVWRTPPHEDGSSVNALDSDVTQPKGLPRHCKTPLGEVIEITNGDIIVVPQYIHPFDPLDESVPDFNLGNCTYGGLFILPPDYGRILYINEIQTP